MSYDDDGEDFDLGDELAGMDDIATGSKILPEEEFIWTIVDAKYKKAKTGTHGIAVTLEIADGPYRGQRQYDNFWYSEKSITMFWGRMKKCGITSEWARETGNTKLSRLAELIKGVTVGATIKHDEWQDEERAVIGRYTKLIGENPNLAGAVTGVLAPPVAQLPDLPEEPEAPVGAAVGTGASTDDPWGTDA